MENSTKPLIIGVGEYLWDVLPDGKKAGGAPVNFAYYAMQAGADSVAISAVGNDSSGRELKAVTSEFGINVIAPVVDKPTGTVDVIVENGIPVYDIRRNVAWDFIPLTEEMISFAKRASAICYGTLAQRSEVSRKTTETLIMSAGESAYRILDVNFRQDYYSPGLVENLMKISNVLKINREELDMIGNMFEITGSEDEMCREIMRRWNLRILILTAGDEYSAVYSGTETSEIETPRVEVKDTVGAGDSFTGTFFGRLLSGKTLAESHRAAVETAAEVCRHSGAWVRL